MGSDRKLVFNQTKDYYFATEADNNLDTLPAGIYKVEQPRTMFGNGPIYFKEIEFQCDNLIEIPNSSADEIMQDMNKFWDEQTKNRFNKYGFVYKRGILLHGKPGTGKTSIMTIIMNKVISMGGIAFFNSDPQALHEAARLVRKNNPDVPLVIVFEEFEQYYSDTMLCLLDGQLQIDNVVYLATTNHISKIPNKLKNRPSRFALVKEIGYPSEVERRHFLMSKLPEDHKGAIEMWVAHTKDLSFDHMKELIVCTCCLGLPLGKAAERIKLLEGEADNDPEYDEEENFN